MTKLQLFANEVFNKYKSCITNKQNKNVNSHKQKHDHHQN